MVDLFLQLLPQAASLGISLLGALGSIPSHLPKQTNPSHIHKKYTEKKQHRKEKKEERKRHFHMSADFDSSNK